MTIWSREQILSCINDPNYAPGSPRRPMAYAVSRQAEPAAVAAKLCFYAVRPGPNTILEIRAVYHNALDVRWHLLSQAQFTDAALGQTITETLNLWRLQHPAIGALARAELVHGTYTTVPAASTKNSVMMAELSGKDANPGVTLVPLSAGIMRLVDPIVLFDDVAPNLFVLVSQNGNMRLRATAFCREWPIDTSNY